MASSQAWRVSLVQAALLSFGLFAAAHPLLSDALLKRAEITIDDVQDEYDYVIVGGGQAGLVIANRLTEDPDVSVLVVEYGYFNNAPTVSQPASAMQYFKNVQFNMTSIPQKELGGYKQDIYAACCVGGGSTINGMLLNRGSAADYDSWEALGNPGWGWEGLYPYFIKSSRFDAPDPATVEEFGITWGEDSFGDGPIHLSISSYQYPGIKIQRQGLIEAGAPTQVDALGGDAFGVLWWPSALDNATATRSYAVSGYWNPVKDERNNFNIIVGWRVDEVLFNDKKHATSVALSQRGNSDQERVIVKARNEIVIAAGALHSPQVLQRSGVGPKDLLEAAKIPLVHHLPGVGSNLQDHAVAGVSWRFETNVLPNPQESMSNATFAKWAAEELAENHAGPLRIITGNSGGLIPLPIIDPEGYEGIVESYRGLDVEEFLPENYSPEQISGYKEQRKVMSDMMSRPDNAFLELPFFAGGDYSAVLIKVLSRGTVLLNPEDIYADPIVDYGTYTIPTDREMMRSIIRFFRKFHATDAMKELTPVEQKPGEDIVSDEDLDTWLRSSTSCSTAHNSATCAMMPEEHGGVVGPDLLVHGVTGLSVADSSIMPIMPGAHICSTVYAIAEKAADLIKERHSSKKEKPKKKCSTSG